jgi:hypothetical protein
MFGSGHGISGPVHDLLRTIPYHIYTCSKTLPDVKEEIMLHGEDGIMVTASRSFRTRRPPSVAAWC